MAVAELIVSRRALLAAACAPLLSRHPGLDPGPRNTAATPARAALSMDPGLRRDDEEARSFAVTKWDRALARYRVAEAALVAAAHAPEEVYDRLGARHDSALKRLLRVPAPHSVALADKLELAVSQQAWELTGGEACMAALIADARGLATDRGGRR